MIVMNMKIKKILFNFETLNCQGMSYWLKPKPYNDSKKLKD